MNPETPEQVLQALIAEEFNRLRGRLLGLIESWGLPDTQERGCKNTLKTLSYDAQARITDLCAGE